MWKPGIDDLAFVGFGQAIPRIFPFAERDLGKRVIPAGQERARRLARAA